VSLFLEIKGFEELAMLNLYRVLQVEWQAKNQQY